MGLRPLPVVARRAIACAVAVVLVAAGCRADRPLTRCGECGPSLVAADGDGVALAQGRTLWRFSAEGDEASRTAILPTRRATDAQALVVTADGRAWIGAGPVVIRVGRDGAVERSRRAPAAYVTAMATDGGTVWMSAGRRVLRLAPDGSVARRSAHVGARADRVALGRGVVWARAGRPLALRADDLTAIADPGPAPAVLRPWPEHALVAQGAGALWTATRAGVLQRRDPATGEPSAEPLDVGAEVTSLAVADRIVWMGLREGGVVRVEAGPEGPRVAWTREVPVT